MKSKEFDDLGNENVHIIDKINRRPDYCCILSSRLLIKIQ